MLATAALFFSPQFGLTCRGPEDGGQFRVMHSAVLVYRCCAEARATLRYNLSKIVQRRSRAVTLNQLSNAYPAMP